MVCGKQSLLPLVAFFSTLIAISYANNNKQHNIIDSTSEDDRYNSIDVSNKFQTKQRDDKHLRSREEFEMRILRLEELRRNDEMDTRMLIKWLVDNIGDLHRQMKQSFSETDHYTKVTARLFAQTNELCKTTNMAVKNLNQINNNNNSKEQQQSTNIESKSISNINGNTFEYKRKQISTIDDIVGKSGFAASQDAKETKRLRDKKLSEMLFLV